MDEDLEFLLEGDQFTVYFYKPGGRHDPSVYWETLPDRIRQSLLASFQAYADHGQVPSRASGHSENWYHVDPPANGIGVKLFKFKDDPRIRFYSVVYSTVIEARVVLTYGFQDPKKGTEANPRSQTGRATKRAEEFTRDFILRLSPQ